MQPTKGALQSPNSVKMGVGVSTKVQDPTDASAGMDSQALIAKMPQTLVPPILALMEPLA